MDEPGQYTVGLFVTCLVDLYRPSVAHATISLIESAGFKVVVPTPQTCCGQPAFNSGDNDTAINLAKQLIDQFEHVDYLVLPSGSCAAMIKMHYPELFHNDSIWHRKASDLARKTYELTQFLSGVAGYDREVKIDESFTYHDSCSGLRELGIKQQPRQLLQSEQLKEMNDAEICCGFGGTFCVKYPDISTRMADDKLQNIAATGTHLVVGGDLGCLLNIAGRAKKSGMNIRCRHIAELLNNDFSQPPLGESK